MKRIMRRIVAAVLAMGCLPVAGITASAEPLSSWYGTAKWDAFADLEYLGEDVQHSQTTEYYLDTSSESENILAVMPRTKSIRFVLREDADMETAPKQAAALLDAYFPGLINGERVREYDTSQWYFQCDGVTLMEEERRGVHSRVFDLNLNVLPENADALEKNILLDLARNHLISEFYGWGGTADYDTLYFLGIDHYPQKGDGGQAIDWTAVQSFLDTAHPGYTVKSETNDYGTAYSILAPETLTRKEEIRLAFELWQKTELPLMAFSEPSEGQTTNGHNALESPGDVTLDCELDILDVIAANKYLLGAETLCDTAKTNADINADGTPDETDSLAILKEVVGITEGFA